MNPKRRPLFQSVPFLVTLAIGTAVMATLTVVVMIVDGDDWPRLLQTVGFLGLSVVFTLSAVRYSRAQRIERTTTGRDDE